MAIEKGKGSYRFTSKLSYDPAEPSDLSDRHGTYEENENLAVLKTAILGVRFQKSSTEFLQEIMDRKLVHQNLMHMVIIDECKYGISRAFYGYEDHITLLDALEGDVIFPVVKEHGVLRPHNLRMFTSQVVAGLKKLHDSGFYHGNLKVETTHFLRTENEIGGVVRLGGFQSNSEKIRGDWSSLGGLLDDLLVRFVDVFSNSHELKCLTEFLRGPHVALSRAVKSILGHPAFLSPEDRPLFIIEIVSYLLDILDYKQVMPSNEHLEKATTKTNVLNGDSLENYQISKSGQSNELWNHVVNQKAYRRPSARLTDCLRMGIIVRDLLSHHKENMNHPISNIIGQNMVEIDNYFRTVQPNLVIALYISATIHGFTFSKYDSLVPFDDDLLS